ncbi:MAG: Spy/CpxP family protein refolding chaperone [Bacteroidales bacterium]|nr:Spy/CpxP family protein refolding chaperone [Bacteroidales bacterium]
MKRIRIKKQIGLVAILLALATAGSMAQCPSGGMGQGNGNKQKVAQSGNGAGYFCNNIPNLTDEQKLAIDKIKLDQKKAALETKTEIDSKKIKLNALLTTDNPDKASIDKLIDEIGKLKTDMQKKHAANLIEIRKLLTEEQKVYFDNHMISKGFGSGQGGKGGHMGMR